MNNNGQITKTGSFANLSGKGKFFFSIQIIAVFAVTFAILYVAGLVPNELKNNQSSDLSNPDNTETEEIFTTQTRPERIIINKLGINNNIEHPTTQNVSILDQFLSKGVVHYPGSGMLEEGNIFLFGHSADRFQFVSNEALKVFNGLSELDRGDLITLTGNDKEYVYEVEAVTLVDASTAFVDFSKNGQNLTLSTCNTFGAAQERWVVEATLKTVKS